MQTVETGGKAAVRQHLIGRLTDAGLSRPKGMTADQLAAMQGRLVGALAYMDPENLMTLAEGVMDMAAGPLRNQWPSEVIVRNAAHALQRPPFEQPRIVSSWLASVEGPQAEAGGWLVPLYRFLRRAGRPPMPYDMRLMREEAGHDSRQLTLIRERVAAGSASDEDRAWLVAWQRDEAEARRIVRDGATRRATGDGQSPSEGQSTGDAA
ncbi:hypothetical protein [Roseicitreum antarcticum]|uniref:Uncharacterized protein n=1 Tax=Roseicitreum antarcticum TaxID=564137 RepID=A0A1H2WAT2_9RHOB|nr:hypothetical protein [Roseicitreum antarcticum]SDW77803.1 hypothetical protein SAMN04488238_103325 [Roseicitreum antarcticum]